MSKRFVHTSTHTTKSALILQLSYILVMYNSAKITLKELSEKTGVSASTLSRIKNGYEGGHSLDSVLRLADAIDLEYRVVTERVDGVTTNHTYVEPATDYCKRKGLAVVPVNRVPKAVLKQVVAQLH